MIFRFPKSVFAKLLNVRKLLSTQNIKVVSLNVKPHLVRLILVDLDSGKLNYY